MLRRHDLGMGKQHQGGDELSIRAKHERRDLRRRMELTEERLEFLERLILSPRSPDSVDIPLFRDHLRADG